MSETFSALLEKTKDEFESIGLYMSAPPQVHGNPMSEEIGSALQSGEMNEKAAIESGLADFFLMCEFTIGKVAWTQRVLDPEGHAAKHEFKKMLPDDEDAKLAEIEAILNPDED